MNLHGCHNRKPFKKYTIVQDGWWIDGVQKIAKVIEIPFRMKSDCQYTLTDLGKVDEKCKDCSWKM